MAVFTEISLEKFSRWLALHHHLAPVQRFTAIESGLQNTNYNFQAGEKKYIFTIFEELAAAQVDDYDFLLQHFYSAGLPVAPPLPMNSGKTWNHKPLHITPHLPGRHYTDISLIACENLGALVGKLHLTGKNFPRAITGAWGVRQRRAAWQKIKKLPGCALDAPLIALIERAAGFDRQFYKIPQQRGLCHRDLIPGNVLWQHDAVSGLIDFYIAGEDFFISDLATCAWGFGWDQHEISFAKLSALITGYQKVNRLNATELAIFPRAFSVAAYRFLVSNLFDQFFPRPAKIVINNDRNKLISRFATILAMEHDLLAQLKF